MHEQDVHAIFSANLRNLMARENMTQRELARRLGTGASTVNEWVNGRQVPRTPLLNKLMEVFGCHASQLLTPSNGPAELVDLTEEELKLVTRFRNAPSVKREAILNLLD